MIALELYKRADVPLASLMRVHISSSFNILSNLCRIVLFFFESFFIVSGCSSLLPMQDPVHVPIPPDIIGMFTEVMRSVNNMMEKFDRMFDLVHQLMEERGQSNKPNPHPPPPTAYSTPSQLTPYAIQRALQEVEKKKEKASRAVICLIPELESHVDTTTQDERLISGLIQHVDIPEITDAWRNGTMEHHRHPRNKQPNADGPPLRRPIKLQFPTDEMQRSFIKAHRKLGRPPCLTELAAGGFVRNDLTTSELQEEYRLRGEVREQNLAAGELRYGIRDATRITYKNPRPLPPNYQAKKRQPDTFSDGPSSPLMHR